MIRWNGWYYFYFLIFAEACFTFVVKKLNESSEEDNQQMITLIGYQ
jgi:hypothetical protein